MDHYRRLGVPLDATYDAIHEAYRGRARALHPDANGTGAEAHAEDEMAAVNEAWYVLRDPERRRAYDNANTAPTPAVDFTDQPETWDTSFDVVSGRSARLQMSVLVMGLVMVIIAMATLVLIAMSQGH